MNLVQKEISLVPKEMQFTAQKKSKLVAKKNEITDEKIQNN